MFNRVHINGEDTDLVVYRDGNIFNLETKKFMKPYKTTEDICIYHIRGKENVTDSQFIDLLQQHLLKIQKINRMSIILMVLRRIIEQRI